MMRCTYLLDIMSEEDVNILDTIYCKELLIVKCKSKYSCDTTIFFYLHEDIIKDSCILNYYFDNTSIKPLALDRDNEIIVANWLNKNVLNVLVIMIYQSKFKTTHMY